MSWQESPVVPMVEKVIELAGVDGLTITEIYRQLPDVKHAYIKSAIERLMAQRKALKKRNPPEYRAKGRAPIYRYYHDTSATIGTWQQW